MSSLGDVVHALPAVTDAAGMGVRFDWVVEEAFQAVPAAHPAVDGVLPIALRRWRGNPWRWRAEMMSFIRSLASQRYDVAIDSQGLLKSALVTSRARAPRKTGFSRNSLREPMAAAFYSCAVQVPKEMHAIDRQRQLFAGVFGYVRDAAADEDFGLPGGMAGTTNPGEESAARGACRAPAERIGPGGPEDPEITDRWPSAAVPAERVGPGGPEDGPAFRGEAEFGHRGAPERRCFLLHGATWASKRYPENLWVELARLAAAAGLEAVLPWGNDAELGRAQRIARASGATLLPPLGLAELMEALRGARLAVGVDSGLAHLAGALGVPTVVLYGSTASTLTGCRGRGARNLQAEFACSPCRSRVCRYRGPEVRWRTAAVTPPCYGELAPDGVWAAALETMDANRLLHI